MGEFGAVAAACDVVDCCKILLVCSNTEFEDWSGVIKFACSAVAKDNLLIASMIEFVFLFEFSV